MPLPLHAGDRPFFLPERHAALDLSFSFDRDAEPVAWPGDLAVLMIGVQARQSASPTATAQAAGDAVQRPKLSEFAPRDGSFNGQVAAAITRWKDE
jgi:hypothetical protein